MPGNPFLKIFSIAVIALLLFSCSRGTVSSGGPVSDTGGGGEVGSSGEIEEPDTTAHITVGSYNVWNIRMRKDYCDARNNKDSKWYFEGDGVFIDNDPRLWENSRKFIGKAIMGCGYDAFALTEIDDDNMKSDIQTVVKDAGGDYRWIFIPLDGLTGSDGYDVFAYDPEVFAAGKQGTRWLSDYNDGKSPTVYGISSGTNHKKWNDTDKHRTFSYVVLKHKLTGKSIMFCTCHGPLNDDWNTYAGENYIKSYVMDENRDGLPVIFVGDLNSCPYADRYANGCMYDRLKKFWKHAYSEADAAGLLSKDDRENPCTWVSQRGQKSMLKSADHPFKHQLDHIFYSSEFTLKAYRANRYVHNERYYMSESGYRNFFPSDHIPVVASFDL